MSLRQQISAGFVALAGKIKANTSAIAQVSGGIGNLGNLLTSAKSNLVSAINENATNISSLTSGALMATNFAGPDFNPAERPTATNNYPMVGPVMNASAGSLRYSMVRVPLRGENVQDGDVLRLVIQEVVAGSTTGTIIKRVDQVLTAGQTVAEFPAIYFVPSGHLYAFLVGIVSSAVGSDPNSNRFYNGASGYQGSFSGTMSAFINASDGSGVKNGGLSTSIAAGGTVRIIHLIGAAASKTLAGPIDFYDFPTIADTSGLPRNSTGLFDDGSKQYLVKRMLDGSFKYGVNFSTTSATYGAPIGGAKKQVLAKITANDGALGWMDAYIGNPTATTASLKVVTNDQAASPASLTSNSSWKGAAILERVQVTDTGVTGKVRIRIYDTSAASSADWSRTYGAAAGTNAPMLEYVFDSTTLRDHMPGAFFSLVSANNSAGSAVYWTVDQPGGSTRSTATNAITITFRMVG